MNKFNLTKLQRYGVLAEITSTGGGSPVLVINLPVDKRQIGLGGPPHPFEIDKFSAATAHLSDASRREFFESDESCAHAARVLDALARQGEAAAAALADRQLSPEGQLARCQEAMTAALTTIGTQYAGLKEIEAKLRREYAALYAVPEPDAATVPVDVEIRAWFLPLADAEQVRILTDKSRDNSRLMLALKRCPIPIKAQIVSDLVRDSWVNTIALANAEKAATLKIAQDNNEWALRATKQIAYICANPSLSATHGSIDRFRCYQILKPTGGLDVLDFEDGEIGMFERRLQQAAA